tara:strand:+ start:10206 stop:10871 length:666 start_codon:yes stop_codon:yes gene_type:complete
MKHIKLFEAFVSSKLNEASKLTNAQSKKIEEWKYSADRIWYGETYNWLLKNASKFMKAKSADDILKLSVGAYKARLDIQGAWIRQYGPTPTTYEGLVEMLKGIDTSEMGYSGLGKEFDVYLGAHPSYKGGACGLVFATLAYDGKKDQMHIINFGITSGFKCNSTVKSPRSNKDELPIVSMIVNGKLKTQQELEETGSSNWHWGISKAQTWEEIETKLVELY